MVPWSSTALLMFVSILPTIGEFIAQPQDETVFSGTDAHFSCGIRGSSIGWWINDTTFDRLPDKIQSDITIEPNSNQLGFHFSTLKIVGAAKYSGTKVQCISGVDRSNIATMYVQGMLSQVMDLTIQECNGFFLIFWTAPVSLNVTDFNMWYEISIYDLIARGEIDCPECTNITKTSYNFTNNDQSHCYEYIFKITPWNGAGKGQESQRSFWNTSICNGSDSDLDLGGDTGGKKNNNTYIIPVVVVSVAVIFLLVGCAVVVCVFLCLRSKKTKNLETKYPQEEKGAKDNHANRVLGHTTAHPQENKDTEGARQPVYVDGARIPRNLSFSNSGGLIPADEKTTEEERDTVYDAADGTESPIVKSIAVVESNDVPVVSTQCPEGKVVASVEHITSAEFVGPKMNRSYRRTNNSRQCDGLEEPSDDIKNPYKPSPSGE